MAPPPPVGLPQHPYTPTRLAPPNKRPRFVPPNRYSSHQRSQSPKKIVTIHNGEDLRTYSNPDVLVCGNCRELFGNLGEFLEHRKEYCKLRFTCKCSTFTSKNNESASLICALCKESFESAWDLMVHAQAAHMVNIYQLSTKGALEESNPCIESDQTIDKHMSNATIKSVEKSPKTILT